MIFLKLFVLVGIVAVVSITNIVSWKARRSIGMALVVLTIFVTLIAGFVSTSVLLCFPLLLASSK